MDERADYLDYISAYSIGTITPCPTGIQIDGLREIARLMEEIKSLHRHLDDIGAPEYCQNTGSKLLVGQRLSLITGEKTRWVKIK